MLFFAELTEPQCYSGSQDIRSKITSKLHPAPEPAQNGNDYESNADSEPALRFPDTSIFNNSQDL